MGTFRLPTQIDVPYLTDTTGDVTYLPVPGAFIDGTLHPGGGSGTCKATFINGIYLDNDTTPTAVIDLPVGFTVGDAYDFVITSITLAPSCTIDTSFPNLAISDTQTGNFSGAATLSRTGLLTSDITSSVGLDVTFTLTAAAGAVDLPVVLAAANAIPDTGESAAVYIVGTYISAAYVWYYNPTTNHYQFAGEDPGAPWEAADPDPVPVIESVKRYGTYEDGVADEDPETWITPAKGCAGTLILIGGSGFGDDAEVTVDGTPATTVTVVDQTLIIAEVPAHANGAVDIVVTNADTESDTFASGFTYETPWWTQTLTYIVDGVPIVYTAYVQQCEAPSNGIWVIWTGGSPPDFSSNPNGWYMSPAAFTGTVAVVAGASPADPRTWSDIATWAGSSRSMLGGSPAASCTIKNRLIYPGTDYTVNTNDPTIHVFDGTFDRLLCRVPPISGTICKAVLSMLVANGTVYFTTFDSGTSSADWAGRVFQLDYTSAALTQIGAQFTTGEMPYALAWHMGRLWVGTNNGIGTAGKIYYFRPDIDTAWTQDYDTTTSSVGGVDSLCSYKGLLYVGTAAAAGTFAKVLVRSTAGAYTTSDTGSGGTAKINNGFLAMREFEGNLYASYWNNDTTAVAEIRKFDNATWTTAYTGSAGTLRPYIVLFVDDGTLFAIAGTSAGLGLTGVLLSTTDGASWTNQTANLPESTRTFLPMVNVEVL